MTEPLARAPLRLAQIIATAWLFTGQSFVWPGHLALAILSTALCVAILFSPFTRTCCFALAALIGVTLFAEPTWFAHNRLFVAALLFMVSVSTQRFAFLLRWQVALVFLVAALDKLAQPAWRDGRFFESFIAQLSSFGLMWSTNGTVGQPNALATFLEHSGSRPLWMLVGLSVIGLELFLAACFLFGARIGAWLNAIFHLTVFVLTGSTMGQFFFAGAASSLLLMKDDEVPSAPLAIVITAALAGPWTHRYLPLVFLLVWIVRRYRHPT
jgi:hypothetical protein